MSDEEALVRKIAVAMSSPILREEPAMGHYELQARRVAAMLHTEGYLPPQEPVAYVTVPDATSPSGWSTVAAPAAESGTPATPQITKPADGRTERPTRTVGE